MPGRLFSRLDRRGWPTVPGVAGLSLGAGLGVRALHGRAGERERPRLGLRLALRLRGLLLGRGRRRLLREHGGLVLAGEQALELVLVDRLALDQDLRDPMQLLEVLVEHALRRLVRLLDETQA